MDITEPTIQVGHLSQATAEDAVRSSRPMGDEHLSRSLLSTGIVDERQTSVWPEFCEGAQKRVMSPSRDDDSNHYSHSIARKNRWNVRDLRPCEECGAVGVESGIPWDCYRGALTLRPVSYTHLTLPTKRIV